VTQGASDANAGQFAHVVEGAFDSDNSVQAYQLGCDGCVRQVYLPFAKRRDNSWRQRFDVHLQPDAKCRRWIDRRDDLVHPQHVGP